MSDRYAEAVCRRGHIIDYMLNPRMGGGAAPPNFCNDCGAQVLVQCPSCNSAIWGGDRGSFPPSGPGNFCFSCGAPFPWADRAAIAHHLENLLEDSEGLDSRARLELKEQIAVLTGAESSDKSRLAAGKFIMKLVPVAWNNAAPILRTIVTEAVLHELGMR